MSVPGRQGKVRRPLVGVAIVIMACATIAAYVLSRTADPVGSWARASPEVQAVMWPEPRPLADFTLTAHDGRPFSRASLMGEWSFLFFGYTACPDVCPISLQAMRGMRSLLLEADPSAASYRFILVSVDPAQDSPGDLAGYLRQIEPSFTGLTGDPGELETLARSLAVKYAVFEDDSGRRTIDHTSSVIVVDPQARMIGALPAPLRPTAMARQFRELRAYVGN